MDEAIDALLEWATARGAELNGIRPKPLPDRGIGIVATRNIHAGDVVLSVPAPLLRSLGTTPKPVVRRLRGASVHALLAAALCLDDESPEFARWRAVLPTRAAVTAAMPLCWPSSLQELLPAAARALLDSQTDKLARDWGRVVAAYPDSITRDDFVYAWALVNSRTFYHTTPRTCRRLPKDDHMVLQPIADLFNHTPNDDEACSVVFDSHGYTFTAVRSYTPGQELLIRYGCHTNDDLLVEYGFTLDPHPFDAVLVDPYLCPIFSASQRQLLCDAGFWQRYMLASDEACYRTLTALRLACLPTDQWRAVVDGSLHEDHGRDVVDAQLVKILNKLHKEIRSKLSQLDRIKAGSPEMHSSLRTRWLQVKELAMANIARLES